MNLNRNYPFHWNERGTDPVAGPVVGGNYAGPEAASEPETRANIAFLQAIDPVAYVSLHTGTLDIVRPFGHAPDEPTPDEHTYDAVLDALLDETGLTSRWPGGSGESICYAYGARAIFSLLIEVSEEQDAPATAADLRETLSQSLAAFHFLYQNAERLGAHVVADEIGASDSTGQSPTVTYRLTNDGFGRVWNASLVASDAVLSDGGDRRKVSLDPGESIDVTLTVTGQQPVLRLTYPMLEIRSEERNNRFVTLEARPEAVTGASSGEPQPTPGLEALLAVVALLVAVALRRR